MEFKSLVTVHAEGSSKAPKTYKYAMLPALNPSERLLQVSHMNLKPVQSGHPSQHATSWVPESPNMVLHSATRQASRSLGPPVSWGV